MTTRTREPLIFERSVPGKVGMDLPRLDVPAARDTRPAHLKRSGFDALPSVSEVDVIRHFTRLSKWNYGVDDGLYPLGSCTMKHNPQDQREGGRACPGFADSHPMAPAAHVQGNLALLYTLQEWLKEITGLPAVTLQPSAGAAGELTGVMLIRALPRVPGRQAAGDPAARQRPRHQPGHRRHGRLRGGGGGLPGGRHRQLRRTSPAPTARCRRASTPSWPSWARRWPGS